MTTFLFDVPEISCGHCKAAIEGEVGRLPDVARVEVDVAARTVLVEGGAGEDDVVRAIDDAGYAVAGRRR
jgi:copper chaperone